MTEDELVALILGGPPNPTQTEFINDYCELVEGKEDSGWEAAYMGPVGCAKTSTMLAKAWLQLLWEPGCQILISRQNFNDLKDTTYKRMEEMLARLPPNTLIERSKSPPIKWTIQPIGDTGEFSSVTFMGLTDSLGSYEFHSAYIDEADEVDFHRFNEVRGRCRLKGHSRIVACAFNPPSEDHWLYTECTGLDIRGRKVRDPGLKLFVPQPRENEHNVRAGYYDDLRRRFPPDMVRRLVEGQWGSTFMGQAVYGSEFKRDWHVRETKFDDFLPLFRFWDFGYRYPVCLWAQATDDGGLNILREDMGQDIELRPFANKCKAITAREFPGARNVIDYGDPAAVQKKDTGSTLGHLHQEGITLRYIKSFIDDGLRAVRHLLSRTVRGAPAFTIDRRCHISIRALEGGYHYPNDGEGDPAKPVKDGYYDHPMDALRYGVVNVFGPIGTTNVGLSAAKIGALPENISYDPSQDSFTAGFSRHIADKDW